MDSLKELEHKTKAATEKNTVKNEDKDNGGKLSYDERKEIQKEIRKYEKLVADDEMNIDKVEKQIAEMELKLSTPEGASDISLYDIHTKLKKEADEITEIWMEHTTQLEELKNKLE
jgi:hypothetical protein